MREFAPTLDELRDSGMIFYEVVAGSVAYGLNTAASDEDLRGYYHVPHIYRGGLSNIADQTNDAKHDITYYNLKRAFELLMTANPNQIELLWIPDDCVRTYNKVIMDDLMDNKELFISKASYASHWAYARAQIGKSRGQNKWVNNPKPKTPPTKEDFCWFVDVEYVGRVQEYVEGGFFRKYPTDSMPCRPIALKETSSELDLSQLNCAKMEHMENAYRLYRNASPKGVFRGPNEQLVCESVSKDDEWKRFHGLLIYNEQAWKKAQKDWSEYWKWMKNRNEARWVDQEKGKLDYDCKNMSHCLRLMISSKHILTEGYPLVRFEGAQKKLLMDIKNGELEYDDIMERVNNLQAEIEVLVDKTHIPETVDFGKLNTLYAHLNGIAEKTLV
jgi:predicted nucleotidyltransferase